MNDSVRRTQVIAPPIRFNSCFMHRVNSHRIKTTLVYYCASNATNVTYLQFESHYGPVNLTNNHVTTVLDQERSHSVQDEFDIFPRQVEWSLQGLCRCRSRRRRIIRARVVKGRDNIAHAQSGSSRNSRNSRGSCCNKKGRNLARLLCRQKG